MQKIITLCLLAFMGIHLMSQSPTDTVRVMINGQTATIENKGTGKKTTLTFEDSLNVFQVSVIKFSKTNWPMIKENAKSELGGKSKNLKAVRWFGEGSLGLIMNSVHSYRANSPLVAGYYSTFDQSAFVTKLNYVKVKPGFRLELFIKEKRREWNKKGLYLITGSHLQYNQSYASGIGTIDTYKTDSTRKIYRDSLTGSYNANIISRFGNIRFCVPVIIEKQVNRNNRIISLQGGILFGVNSYFINVKEKSGTGSRSEGGSGGNDGTSFISFQPVIRLLYNNRVSFNLTYDLNKSKFGFGGNKVLVSHPICFSIGYRFY